LQALRAPDLDIRYAPVNVAKSSHIAKDLLADARMRGMLVEANRADLELYEHVTRELFPAQLREYGPSLPESVGALQGGRNGFNRRNLAMYGIKQRWLLKPAMQLYRRSATRGVVEALVG